MGDYFDGFVDEETRTLGLTREAVRGWAPRKGERSVGSARNRALMVD